jgi:hypothetical protein
LEVGDEPGYHNVG